MRIGRTILGLMLIAIGAGAIAVGVIGITAFGSAGTLEVTSNRLTTEKDAYALVADVQGISAGFPGSDALGTTTIGARGVNGERLFVGLATGGEANDYLFGVPFEAVRQNGSAWQTLPVPGAEEPPPPNPQKFWLRKATGPAPSFEYTGGSGTSTLVIMNADGSPAVTASIRIAYVSGTIFPISLAAIAIGAVVVVLGLFTLLRWARRRRPRRNGQQEPVQPAAPAELAPDAPTAPTPQQRTPPAAPQHTAPEHPAPESQPVDDRPVVVDVTGPEAGRADRPSEEAGLPDEWFRRSDASP